MSFEYLGVRGDEKGVGYLTVNEDVTVTVPAGKSAYSYGHIEILGTIDIEGTLHNGGTVKLGPGGDLVINGHMFNVLTFVLGEGAEGHDLPTEYDYAYEFYLPTASDVSKEDFVFGGWFDDSGCTKGPVTWISAHSTEARTFYAKWYGSKPCGENLYYAVDDQHNLIVAIQGAPT